MADELPVTAQGTAVPNDALLRAAAGIMVERALLARALGQTFGGKRKMYEVLGYDEIITAQQYRDRYRRGGIAGRVVDALPKAVWRGEGFVFEDEDPEHETNFEKDWKAINKKLRVWSTLLRTHILAQQSSYAVLLLGATGNLESELPRGKPGSLLYLTPYCGGVADTTQRAQAMAAASTAGADVVVDTWDEDTRSARFGLPKTYQLTRAYSPTSGTPRKTVHWTRVIHVPASGFLDDAVYGPPALENVWNYLDDLDKVVGGGAEAFWLRANAGLHVDVDKKMTLSTDPVERAAELASLKEQAEAYEHQLTRMLRTRGVNVNQLGSDVADISGPSDAIVTLIAGTKGIPKRILTGSEMGELASSQDRTNWNDQIKDERSSYALPVVLRPFIDRLIEYGYLTEPEDWDVMWPDADSMSEGEKLDAASKMIALNDHGQVVIQVNEVREFLDYEPLDEDELQPPTAVPQGSGAPQPLGPGETPPSADEGEEEQVAKLEAALRRGQQVTIVVGQHAPVVVPDGVVMRTSRVEGDVAVVGFQPKTLGGPGSGNFGHAGRPGEIGGSSSEGGGSSSVDVQGRPRDVEKIQHALAQLPKDMANDSQCTLYACASDEEAKEKIDEYLMRYYGVTAPHDAVGMVDRERGAAFTRTDKRSALTQFAHTLGDRIDSPAWDRVVRSVSTNPSFEVKEDLFTKALVALGEETDVFGIVGNAGVNLFKRWGWL